MDLFRYIVRFLYKIRWYLIILPLIALIVAWFLTRNMERVYDTNTTIYTGMITGYNIEGGVGTAGRCQNIIRGKAQFQKSFSDFKPTSSFRLSDKATCPRHCFIGQSFFFALPRRQTSIGSHSPFPPLKNGGKSQG